MTRGKMEALYDQATYRMITIKQVALEDDDYNLLHTRLQELQTAIRNVIKCDKDIKEENYDGVQ